MTKITLLSACLYIGLISCTQKEASHASKTNSIIQSEDVTVRDLSPVADKNKFPLVNLSKNKDVENKINTTLQLEQLEHLPGVFKKNPFEKVTYGHDNGMGGSVNFYEYTQNSTISNILSLTLKGEGTGAYSENFDYYYNFDLRTGNKILLQQLFTEDGLNNLTQLLNQRVKKEIDDYLAKLQKPTNNQKITEEDSTALDDEEGMYEECLGSVMDYKPEYYSFNFTHDSIVFERERCSNHAMRALDELDKFDISLSFKELKSYLSVYGENLLNNSNTAIETQSPEGKLYKGFIDGKYPISAMIGDIYDDGSFSMNYWYNKTKIPITWNGSFANQHFSLTESKDQGDSSIEVAKIEANWVNNKKIIGTWTNAKTKQVLKLELEAY